MEIEIEDSKVNNLLKELFFDEVIGLNRIAYAANEQNYDFTTKLDGVVYGREYGLSVEIFTSNYNAQSAETLKRQTMGLPVLRLVVDSDGEFMDDVKTCVKMEDGISTDSDSPRLRHSLKERADEMLGKARAFVNGTEPDVLPRSSGQAFVIECFQHLIDFVYPNLRMLGNFVYTEDTFKHILRGFPVPELFEDGDDSVSEAESQIVDFVNGRDKQREKTSIYNLRKHFSEKPFGWSDNATFTLLSMLYKKNKIEVIKDRDRLNEDDVVAILLDTSKHNSAFVDLPFSYSLDKMMELKLFYSFLSNTFAMKKDDMEVARDFPNQFAKYVKEIGKLMEKKNEFPFVSLLQSYYDEMHSWTEKNYRDLLDNASNLYSLVLDVNEDEYEPIYEFVNGEGGKKYRNIVQTVEDNLANIDFVEGPEPRRLNLFLKHPHPYRGNVLKDAEQNCQRLEDKLAKLIEEEQTLTIQQFEEELITLLTHPEIIKLKESDNNKLLAPMEKKMAKLKTQRFIGNLRAARADLPNMVENILNQAVRLNASADKSVESPKQPVRYITKNNIPVSFDKSELTTEDDVRVYVEELERTLLNQIQNNKRIRL